MNNVGKNIRTLRKAGNLTQDELAERIHVTRQTISNYENGKSEPDLEMLGLIAEAFGTDITELIYGKKEESSRKAYRILFIMLAVLAAVSILSYQYAKILSARGRALFVNPYAVYVLLFGVLPYAVWLCGYVGGILIKNTVGSRGSRWVHRAALVLSAAGGLLLTVFTLGCIAAGKGYGAYVEKIAGISHWVIPYRSMILPYAAVMGVMSSITGQFKAENGRSTVRSLILLTAVPVLLLGLYAFKYDSPCIYRVQNAGKRQLYRIPQDEVVLTFYKRINGELIVSHHYYEGEQLLCTEMRLPVYSTGVWIKETRLEYLEEAILETLAVVEMQGKSLLLPLRKEQILCIDKDHSLYEDPSVYLDGTDDLWMITVYRP